MSPLEKIKQILGSRNYLEDPAETLPYGTAWRGGHKKNPALVALPVSVSQIQEIMKICHAEKIPVIPQGGNTGLVAGSVPISGREIIMNLSRMNKIRTIDKSGFSITAEAGVVLKKLQETAEENGMFFPLSLGSEGSCEVGGIVSTNAGGTAVLRYGNMRDLVLGIEVVLPDGRLLEKLPHVKKDNTGYDLKQIFIGAEGTLGVVTAATLKCFPPAVQKTTIFASADNMENALEFLSLVKSEALTAFEFISAAALEIVFEEMKDLRNPLQGKAEYYILAEFSSLMLEEQLAAALQRNLIKDIAVAGSIQQAKGFWALRENISESARKRGLGINFDISVPIAKIPEFLEKTTRIVMEKFPGIASFPFGHLGDGNIHYNFYLPKNTAEADFIRIKSDLKKIVYDAVTEVEGSISAEHGIGLERREDFLAYKPALEIELMRKIKKALDPDNIMNPGKIFV